SSKGFCMKHFGMLTEGAYKHLKNPDEFVEAIYKLEYENLKTKDRIISKVAQDASAITDKWLL
ncbi:MAG: hypothetical protein IKA37_06700, partial [Spirochaetales bacterium]|nr:hypothetical protein [Spirochaetales bacterium]